MTSRNVALSSTFLLLAAGGLAACDSSGFADSADSADETFYCADANGRVVDEDHCDDDGSALGGIAAAAGAYYIWHSVGYRSGYPVGYRLPSGGSRFAYNDRGARSSFGLPSTGRIGNGTVKTSVVGKGGRGTTVGRSGGSGSTGHGSSSGG